MTHEWRAEVIKGVSHFDRGPAYGVKVWRDGVPFHFERIYGGKDGRARRAFARRWAAAVQAKGLVGYYPTFPDKYVGSSFKESDREGWK